MTSSIAGSLRAWYRWLTAPPDPATRRFDNLGFLVSIFGVFAFLLACALADQDLETVWTLPETEIHDPEHPPAPVFETWATRCVYPVSGTYTRFQRRLFSVVVLVVFLFRSHRWVLVAGVGWVAGYCVPALLHGLALTFGSSDDLDADVPVAFDVLCTAMIARQLFYILGGPLPTSLVARGLQSAADAAFWSFVYGAIRWQSKGQWVSIDVDRWYQSEADIEALSLYENVCDVIEIGRPPIFRGINERLQPTPWLRSSVGLEDTLWWTFPWKITEIPILAELLQLYMVHLVERFLYKPLGTRLRLVRNFSVRCITTARREHNESSPQFVVRSLLTALVILSEEPWFNAVLFPVSALVYLLTIASDTLRKKMPDGIRSVSSVPLGPPTDSPPRAIVYLSRAVGILPYCFALLAAPFILSQVAVCLLLTEYEVYAGNLPQQESTISVGQWAPWVSVAVVVFVSLNTRFFASPGDREGSKEEALLLHELDRDQKDLSVFEDLPLVFQQVHHCLLRWYPPLDQGYLRALSAYSEMKAWWNDPITVSWQSEPSDQERRSGERGQQSPRWQPLVSTLASGEEDDEVITRVLGLSPSSSRFALPSANDCSRQTYADYLPCACAACRGRPGASVEYSTEEEQAIIEALFERREMDELGREHELMEMQ